MTCLLEDHPLLLFLEFIHFLFLSKKFKRALAVAVTYFIICGPCSLWAETSGSFVVGRVGPSGDSVVVTSREIRIEWHVAAVMDEDLDLLNRFPSEGSSVFNAMVDQLLDEWCIYLEANQFNQFEVAEEVLGATLRDIRPKLDRIKSWRSLQVTSSELQKIIRRRLRVEKMIRFKLEVGHAPVSDSELRQFYEVNKKDFPKGNFGSHREAIRRTIEKEQEKKRIAEWIQILRTKYKVRKFNQ